MYGSKQSINDKAVDDSDKPLLETKTNEVTQILNKFPTCVLIIPSKETKGEENDEIQVLQPSKQPNKVTQVLTSHQPFQTMSTPENVSMTDAPEDDDVQLGVQTPRQVAQARRNGPPTPVLVDQFPGAGNGTPPGSDAPGTIQGQVTNKHLKEAVVALMKAHGMPISQAFEVHLDHLEQANMVGHELLDKMER